MSPYTTIRQKFSAFPLSWQCLSEKYVLDREFSGGYAIKQVFDPDKKARLVQFGKRLTLVRQGKIPLQKLAYQAHAYLRGAKVSFVFDKSIHIEWKKPIN